MCGDAKCKKNIDRNENKNSLPKRNERPKEIISWLKKVKESGLSVRKLFEKEKVSGTGGGLPGLILAICYPHAQFLLMDSTTKKIRVVANITKRLHRQNRRVIAKRVEAVEGTFDFITDRSVATSPPDLSSG